MCISYSGNQPGESVKSWCVTSKTHTIAPNNNSNMDGADFQNMLTKLYRCDKIKMTPPPLA
jgi:hypothetical protein